MTISKLVVHAIVASLVVSASASVFATSAYQGLPPSQQTTANAATTTNAGTASISASAQPGKTRDEVYTELVQAERDGLVPIHHNDYPPSARTIQSNRVRFALAESYWQAGDTRVAGQR